MQYLPPPPGNRVVYEIMSKNVVEPEATGDNIIWRTYFASWIRKATRARAHAQICNTLLLHGNRGFVKASNCFVIRTLPVLLATVELCMNKRNIGLLVFILHHYTSVILSTYLRLLAALYCAVVCTNKQFGYAQWKVKVGCWLRAGFYLQFKDVINAACLVGDAFW
jgi:hypothetical protein